jgi:myo-inositol-1(or 4)-monophosphatase
MSAWKEISVFANELARETGALIRQEREHATLALNYKDHRELVTSADVKADEWVRAKIQERFPAHHILSEELAPDYADASQFQRDLWIVDPIDGTVNYSRQHYQAAVSLAFAAGGQVRVAAVYCPFLDELFHAVQGQGAFLNDQPIRVNADADLPAALIATGFPYHRENVDQLMRRLKAMLMRCGDVRRLGAAALDICWVAMGRMDGFYETLSPWDFAAAQLIAREAGAELGHIGDVPATTPAELYGEDLIVASPAIFAEMQNILRAADGESA